jgi:hypothetical protein
MYSSYALAVRLEKEHQMTCIGTLKANRKGLPKAFKEVKNRPEGDYQVLYEEGTRKSIHSWVTNTKSGPKNVMMITTTCPILQRATQKLASW